MNVADGDDAIDAVPFTWTGGGKRTRAERDNGRHRQRPYTRDSQSGHGLLYVTGVSGDRPASTASTFSIARPAIAVRVSVVPLARCGTRSTFSRRGRSGWIAGSFSYTSSAAPASRCCCSAHASASSSTTGPHAVLIRYADRF